MKLIFVSVALAFAPTAANAAPVTLNCTLKAAEPLQIDVELNEASGTATYTFPANGRTYRIGAFFAPDRVSFNKFSIDRKSLAIQRVNNGAYDQSVWGNAPVDHGTCVVDTQKRAF